MTGTVHAFFPDRGYGFLRADTPGTPDLFIHVKALRDGNGIKQGDRVEYDLGQDPIGRPRATNVRVIASDDSAPQVEES